MAARFITKVKERCCVLRKIGKQHDCFTVKVIDFPDGKEATYNVIDFPSGKDTTYQSDTFSFGKYTTYSTLKTSYKRLLIIF